MCGIAGILYFNEEKLVEQPLINRMTDSLIHRGPDNRGTYIEGNIGLGFRRLSIIDLSFAGHQPMCNEDESAWIVFNGEIYNYQELKPNLEQKGHRFKSRTDTEVIIHAYEEYGLDCLEYLDGMFAFAIWDSSKRELFCARDRFGIKPLHYYCKNGVFAFGSEIKAILAVPGVDRSVDPEALWAYLSFSQVPAPMTIYRDIRKFLPGQAMVLKGDGTRSEWQYWDLKIEEDDTRTEDEWAEEVRILFDNSVRRHLVADVPVGVFLSGGLDSSAIVACASKFSDAPVKTFSVSFSDSPEHDESAYQEIVAQQFGTEHHTFYAKPDILKTAELLIRECDEPFAISSAVPLYHICKWASEHVKVVLTGDGGDELFGGYDWRYGFVQRLNLLDKLPAPLVMALGNVNRYMLGREGTRHSKWQRRIERLHSWVRQTPNQRYLSLISTFFEHEKRSVLQPDVLREAKGAMPEYYQTVLLSVPDSELNRKLYLDAKTSLPDEMLAKTDRCCSMVSIEGRVPFLDKAFAEMAFRIPVKYKLNGPGGKAILKEAFASVVPQAVLSRKKRGFSVPINSYVNSLNFDEILAPPSMFINRENVKKMVASHLSGQNTWGNHLWAIYNLLLWEQRYL